MRLTPLVFLLLLITGCDDASNTNANANEASLGAHVHYVPVENDCNLPFGTVFEDCVSSDWYPTYWRSPVHKEGGREVRADEKSQHYVQVQVLPAQDADRGNVLDVRYGYEPANASLRFKPVNEQTGFADFSAFKVGSLQFDIRVLDWGFTSALSMSVECGWPCASEPTNIPLAPLGEWHRVEISANKLLEQGLDLSRIDSFINITPTWSSPQGIHYQLDNIRWVDEPASQPLEIENRDWAKLARLDLEYIYQTALDNHPGAIDDHNPDFREYLDGGYENAIASLVDVETMQDYADLILNYMEGFNDGHFLVYLHGLPRHVMEAYFADQRSRNIPDYTRFASIEQLDEDVYWVYLPTFLELDDEQRAAMQQVIERLGMLPEDSKVVFDVRWNDGGSEEWAFILLKALYGNSWTNRYLISHGRHEHYADFRVSESNAKFYMQKAESLGSEDPMYVLLVDRYKSIKDALKEGENWYSDASENTFKKWLFSFWYSFGSIESPITPVLVTSDGCASACLGFADLVVRLPNARHLGLETGSDTIYIDVRHPDPVLPSGLGKLVLPMKVWRKRFRDHNESYMPDLTYPGDIYDTQAVQQWVLGTLR